MPKSNSNSKLKKDKSYEVKFLLKHWELSEEHGYDLENRAEKRVAFFLVIASATVAVIFSEPNINQFIRLIVLFILLSFGLDTLQFINWIKINQETHRRMTKIFNKSLFQFSPTLQNIQTKLYEINKLSKKKYLYKIRGGFAEFMYLSNAFLISGITYIIFKLLEIDLEFICLNEKVVIVGIIIIVFLLSIWLQSLISQKIRDRIIIFIHNLEENTEQKE